MTRIEEFGESVATHAARGGEKPRRQRLAASHLTVFVSASRFRQDPGEVYSGAASWRLPFPTGYTPALVAAARPLLGRASRPGFVYHQAGVFLTGIVAETESQQSLLLRGDGGGGRGSGATRADAVEKTAQRRRLGMRRRSLVVGRGSCIRSGGDTRRPNDRGAGGAAGSKGQPVDVPRTEGR